MTPRTLLAATAAALALAASTAQAEGIPDPPPPIPPFTIGDLPGTGPILNDDGCIVLSARPSHPVVCVPIVDILHDLPPF